MRIVRGEEQSPVRSMHAEDANSNSRMFPSCTRVGPFICVLLLVCCGAAFSVLF